MSLFSENPAHFSKSRLKSELVAHNVALPPAKSKKSVYVELHLKHIQRKNAAEFSSDEEDRVENAENGGFVYPQCFLPQSRLYARASRNGELRPKWNSGNAKNSLEPSSQIPVGIGQAVDQRPGLGSGFASDSVMPNGDPTISTRYFSITQMVEKMESLRSHSGDTERDVNGCNVQQHWSRFNRLDIQTPKGDNLKNQSLYPKESTYESEIKEPVKYTFSLPITTSTPTGIYVTCRRPIKGAARRPVQYTYPHTPASPTTQERREVERRLVPVHIQILVFLVVVCLLYLGVFCGGFL